ncbi:Protein-tyrosine phosphatase [Paenibacillus catalpae]|uniref:protein-tyrosine-phosphatase n=1 Tax=Paenibacillus catalpae TaxID=1045775 RepID=A0A1I1XHG4_9BACL|nr:dual specificity protein phosphatase family protein [Paenibacillus catalpae]SFE06807.1 Protein-tyrosine phosphatase [Paenibacillus catalpae]
MEKNYHSLHEEKIFMGGAADVEAMEKNENIDVIVDLRGEADGRAYAESKAQHVPISLGDNSPENQHVAFKQAIDEVVNAYRNGKKVAFHCGAGKGRTGTVAAGTLLKLGIAENVEDAISKAKQIRPIIDVKPIQREALEKIFG